MPVIAVCLGQDPYGFIGTRQGLRGCRLQAIDEMALRIYEVLQEHMPDKLTENPEVLGTTIRATLPFEARMPEE